ncbi:MAG: hypothetical protein WC337_07480 [Candidatus Muiribacteriota bacterium]
MNFKIKYNDDNVNNIDELLKEINSLNSKLNDNFGMGCLTPIVMIILFFYLLFFLKGAGIFFFVIYICVYFYVNSSWREYKKKSINNKLKEIFDSELYKFIKINSFESITNIQEWDRTSSFKTTSNKFNLLQEFCGINIYDTKKIIKSGDEIKVEIKVENIYIALPAFLYGKNHYWITLAIGSENYVSRVFFLKLPHEIGEISQEKFNLLKEKIIDFKGDEPENNTFFMFFNHPNPKSENNNLISNYISIEEQIIIKEINCCIQGNDEKFNFFCFLVEAGIVRKKIMIYISEKQKNSIKKLIEEKYVD